MIAVLFAAGIGVIAGGSFAVGAAGLNGCLGGLLGLLVLAPLVVDPTPALLPLAVRIVGALLAVELLWIAIHRAADLRRPSPLGLRATLLGGMTAVVAGVALRAGQGGPVTLGALFAGLDATTITLAVALGLAVIGLPAVIGNGPIGSVAVGAAVLLTAAELVSVALLGPRTPLEHLLIAMLQVSLAGAAFVVASAAPVGPPLAGRAGIDGATPAGSDEAPLAGRRRVPVWPGVRAVSPWSRSRHRGRDDLP